MFRKIKSKLKFKTYKYLLRGVDVVLITSTGRTGTNFFEHFYKSIDPSAFVFHEPSPDLFDLSIQKVRNKKSAREIQNYIIEYRARLIGSKSVILRRFLGLPITLIEANPFVFHLIDEYAAAFKSFKLIYITRSPDTYLLSAYRKDPNNDGVNNFYDDSDHRSRLTAVDYGEMKMSDWQAMARIERIAWYWNKCNQVLLEIKTEYGNAAAQIRFEDLFTAPTEVRQKVLGNLLNLTHPKYSIEKNKSVLLSLLEDKKNASKKLSKEESLSDFDIQIQKKVENRIAPMRSALGYNNNS